MVGDSGARKPEKERFGLRAIILGQEHPQFGKMRLQPDLEPAPFFRILLEEPQPATKIPVPRRGRRSMSPEERCDVSYRMKKYWAARRAAAGH